MSERIFRRIDTVAAGRRHRHRLARGGCRFFPLGENTVAPSTMGLYSKGTRSKGVTKTFQKQGQANTVQRSRHEKRDAFLAKEAFMKEAMAKHLAAATAAIAEATGDESVRAARGGVAGRPDAAASSDAPSVTPETKAAAAATRPKSKDAKPRAKLRATMATVPGMSMPGSMRWEGKRKTGATSTVDDDADAAKRSKGKEDADKTKIGHLMRPLRGDEIDFATTVDTNVKLPKYARGNQTVVKKRKKNKRRNARLKHCGE